MSLINEDYITTMEAKYEIIIYWSKVDNSFIAEVPGLAGCSAHGNTRKKALEMAEEAIQLWIDTAREFGNPIPKPNDFHKLPLKYKN